MERFPIVGSLKIRFVSITLKDLKLPPLSTSTNREISTLNVYL